MEDGPGQKRSTVTGKATAAVETPTERGLSAAATQRPPVRVSPNKTSRPFAPGRDFRGEDSVRTVQGVEDRTPDLNHSSGVESSAVRGGFRNMYVSTIIRSTEETVIVPPVSLPCTDAMGGMKTNVVRLCFFAGGGRLSFDRAIERMSLHDLASPSSSFVALLLAYN